MLRNNRSLKIQGFLGPLFLENRTLWKKWTISLESNYAPNTRSNILISLADWRSEFLLFFPRYNWDFE